MAKNKKRKLSVTPKASSSASDDHEDPAAAAEPVADDDDEEPTAAEPALDQSADPSQPDDNQSLDPAAPAADGAAEDEESDPDSIQKLLEPFSKDQLLELLRDAAVKHEDVLKEIQKIADADTAHRKIFVHGLGWDTTTESLRAAFVEFGEIEDCKAVMDKATGKSKGYGFILFKHRASAQKALKEPQKKIGNRMTACQLASAGPVPAQTTTQQQPLLPAESEYTLRKIFVSNVGAEVDPQKLLKFFAEFGEIEEGPLGMDKATGKPRGFALFVYKSAESAKNALAEPHKNFEGNILHCQKAIDGPKPSKGGFQFQGASSGYQGVGAVAGQYPKSDKTRNPLAGSGHLMAPPATGLSFNQPAQLPAGASSALNPALGQALTALLATQGQGLGFLGNLGSNVAGGSVTNPGVAGQLVNNNAGNFANYLPANMGNGAAMGGYGAMQGGYSSAPAGRGTGRSQYGYGQMGGMKPYRGQ